MDVQWFRRGAWDYFGMIIRHRIGFIQAPSGHNQTQWSFKVKKSRNNMAAPCMHNVTVNEIIRAHPHPQTFVSETATFARVYKLLWSFSGTCLIRVYFYLYLFGSLIKGSNSAEYVQDEVLEWSIPAISMPVRLLWFSCNGADVPQGTIPSIYVGGIQIALYINLFSGFREDKCLWFIVLIK